MHYIDTKLVVVHEPIHQGIHIRIELLEHDELEW